MNWKKYETISSPDEMYYIFKDEFYNYIIANLPESEMSGKIIEAFNDYKFNTVRNIIDKESDDISDIMNLNLINNLYDKVDRYKFRTIKQLENMFLYFDEKYTELLEINL